MKKHESKFYFFIISDLKALKTLLPVFVMPSGYVGPDLMQSVICVYNLYTQIHTVKGFACVYVK